MDLDEFMDLPASKRLEMTVSLAEIHSGIHLHNPPDFQKFVADAQKLKPERYMGLRSMGEDTFAHALHLAHQAWLWKMYGMNTFQLTHGLAAALMLTEPPKTEGELKLPFPAFAICLPPGIIPIWNNKTGRQEWADMVWVYRFDGYHKEEGFQPFIRWTAEWRYIQAWRDRKADDVDREDDERIYALTEFDHLPEDHDTITLISSHRLIKNLVSWMDATKALEHPPISKKPKRKKSKKAGSTQPRPLVWVLGREVKLRPELRRMASEIALSRSSKPLEGWKARAQHVVRGHWKMQSYGPKRAQRKRIWIEPYWRGPEGEEAWAHVYKA